MKLDELNSCVMVWSGDCSGSCYYCALCSTSVSLLELIRDGEGFSSDHELSRFEDRFGSEGFWMRI